MKFSRTLLYLYKCTYILKIFGRLSTFFKNIWCIDERNKDIQSMKPIRRKSAILENKVEI